MCYLRVGHYRCRIGIDEYHLISLFFKGGARLGACIVKFGSLTYYYRPEPITITFFISLRFGIIFYF